MSRTDGNAPLGQAEPPAPSRADKQAGAPDGAGELSLTPLHALHILLGQQERVFARLAAAERVGAARVFWGYALWLGLLPPLCAFFGERRFGWRLGPGEALQLGDGMALAVSTAYFGVLLAGFFLVAGLASWMAHNYAQRSSLGHCSALTAVSGTPLAVGGVFHLYPSLAFNLGVLALTIVWSIALLYTGLPKILHTNSEQGMLMASSLVCVLLVGLAGLLAVTVLLWVNGLGPGLAI